MSESPNEWYVAGLTLGMRLHQRMTFFMPFFTLVTFSQWGLEGPWNDFFPPSWCIALALYLRNHITVTIVNICWPGNLSSFLWLIITHSVWLISMRHSFLRFIKHTRPLLDFLFCLFQLMKYRAEGPIPRWLLSDLKSTLILKKHTEPLKAKLTTWSWARNSLF